MKNKIRMFFWLPFLGWGPGRFWDAFGVLLLFKQGVLLIMSAISKRELLSSPVLSLIDFIF